jgi:hypothetical protein
VFASEAAVAPSVFDFSYVAGSRDNAGRFMGGTEMRELAAHGGKLYAGNGYWQDRPGPEGAQGAQILVLDGPQARWRVDQQFDERLPNGRPRHLAVSALTDITFSTDTFGKRLSKSISILFTSTWDLTGTTSVFVRDDETGNWVRTTLAQDRPSPDFLPQVRSFGVHRDAMTGIDHVFAGQDPRGIFRGSYDPTVAGRIRWSDAPELDVARTAAAASRGLTGHVRVTSFAECNGHLYAAIGQQIYERADGDDPRWRAIYSNPHPYLSETGLRALTCIGDIDGRRYLLAAVEGSRSRIVRIDPNDGSETTDLDLADFLGKAWRTRVGYVIAGYSGMATLRDARQGELLLLGLEAFIPPGVALAAGHRAVDVGYGRLDAGGWYLVRHPDRQYELRSIDPATGADRPLVATRAIRASPFANDASVYFGGYDANKAPAHDTAWIVRAATAAVVGASR